MAKLLPPPIRDAMFAGKDILQRTWIMFFEGMFRSLQETEDRGALEYTSGSIGESSSRKDDEVALAYLPRSESSSTLPALEQQSICMFQTERSISTKTTDVDPGDVLTLYWMGV